MTLSALLIEDDDDLVEPVRVALGDLGFELDRAADGAEGLQMAVEQHYGLVILDMRLPKLEGVEVCKGIRERKKHVPLVMLTSVGDDMSKILLLELGADDYITKPFNVMEFKARLKAVLRRSTRGEMAPEGEAEKIIAGDLEIDLYTREVKVKGAAVDLTAREFDLLALLASHPGRPFTRQELNSATYGFDVSGCEQSINSHINRIRNKIEESPRRPTYILTVHGVGYKFNVEVLSE